MAVGDWDRRELCPDGNCTGLIGPEGTCKVCGRAAPNWGDERKRGMTTKAEDEDDDADGDEYEDEAEDESEPDPVQPGTPVEIGEWSERKLCSDGSCVGVIGDNGTCKVCGKPAGAAAAAAGADADEDDEDDDDDEYEDDAAAADDEGDDDDDDDEDDELAAAAADLAGVATSSEVAAAKDVASAAGANDGAKPRASAKDEEDNRQLCPDGGCIGVIGPNGRCKVCGKEAAA